MTQAPVREADAPAAETPAKRAKVVAKDPATKVAHQRLSVLELAQRLGNVAEACRRGGMDRTSFYEWKKRFEAQGLDGLNDLPPVHKAHPQATPPETVEKIVALAKAHPSWGCNRLADRLKLDGVWVSAPTVQAILNKQGLGSQFARYLALEEQALREGLELTPEQVERLEKANPCFRERHVESSRPGQLLSQDTFEVGRIKGVGRVYLQAVVDTYGSYAFGYLHTGKLPEHAALVVHNDVLPFYKDRELNVAALLTDNGREYCGKDTHPYELYLALNGVEHRRTKVGRPRTNGFVERFHRTVKDEFLAEAFRAKFYVSVEELQADLDAWLRYYNQERPHQGYRNLGKRPIDTVNAYLAQQKTARQED